MTRAIAIVGTDTGVGKTFLTRALLIAARAEGLSARPLKPLLSGVGEEDDGILLARESGLPLEEVSPYRILPPLSPAAALRRGLAPAPDDAVLDRALARGRAARPDWLLLEGIGGLACPIDATRTWCDLHARWNEELGDCGGLPAILVARGGLGTLSQSLLSLEALARREIRVLAIVLSQGTPPEIDGGDSSPEDNAEILAERTGRTVLRLPFVREPAEAAGSLSSILTQEIRA